MYKRITPNNDDELCEFYKITGWSRYFHYNFMNPQECQDGTVRFGYVYLVNDRHGWAGLYKKLYNYTESNSLTVRKMNNYPLEGMSETKEVR